MRITRQLGSGFAIAALTLVGLAAPTAASAADPITVSIRAELDLPNDGSDGPRVFEVANVVAGDGPELTGADETSNPSDWCGSLEVDVDPVGKTISVYSDPDDICNFETARVTITSAQIGALTLVGDTLFDETLCPEEEEEEEPLPGSDVVPSLTNGAVPAVQVDNGVWTFDYTSESGVVSLFWNAGDASYDTCGLTVLTFADPAPAALPATGTDAFTIFGLGAGTLLLGFAAVAFGVNARRNRRVES